MRIRTLVVAAAALLIIGGLAGCTLERGSGQIETVERDVTGFERIELEGSGRLEIVQGRTEGVSVTADDNLLEYITTEVEGDTLIISTVNRRNGMLLTIWPTEDPVFRVEVKDLTKISIAGSADTRVDALETPELEVDVSGSGSLDIRELDTDRFEFGVSGTGEATVAGRADEVRIDVSGSGDFDGTDLESERAEVSISGSGDAILWVSEDLEVDVSGSGSVDYYGSPSVDQQVSGSGSVESKGNK